MFTIQTGLSVIINPPLSEVNDVNRLLLKLSSSFSSESILQFQLLCLSLASLGASLGAAQLADFNDLFRLASLGSNRY